MQRLDPDREKAPRGRDAVVEALIASATRLFAERGTEGASVREVAAGAGVNHALVFRHFGSKERLVRVVLDRQLDGLLAQFRQAGLDPAALAAVGEGVAERELLWKLMTRAVMDGEIDFLTERSFPEMSSVLEAIERGAEAGGVPKEVEPQQLLLVVLSGALGWALLDPVLAEVVGAPGETPERRRELARSAFSELLGIFPAGATRLSESEEASAAVPTKAPAAAFAKAQAATKPAWSAAAGQPPRGREQVCDALVAAAMELFSLRGPTAVSVRQVAARAGVNHALVFRHFGSKDGLIQAVWDRVVEDLAGRVVRAPDYQGFTALTEALAESETIWRLLVRAILDGKGETIAANPYRFVDAMVWATARGQEAGMVETRIHARLVVAMVCAMGIGWLIFHPVLIPLLGLPDREPAQHRQALRNTAVQLLGWHGAPPLAGHSH